MRRKKCKANRRVTRWSEDDVAEVDNETGPSKIAVEAAGAGNESEKDVNQEIDCFKEEFEEVDNLVSAVIEMDSVIQLNQTKNGDDVVENKSKFTDASIGKSELNLEVNALNGLGESEKSDYLDVSLENSKFEDGSINIDATDVDSRNEIENCEEAKGYGNAEQKSIEGEPSVARITVTTLAGPINDGYSNKDDNDGEKEESRGDWKQKEDIEVRDANKVPQVLNHKSITKQKQEKTLEIYVGGLHKETVEQDLFEVFGKFGEVQNARIVRNGTKKKSRGFAFIQYATAEQAKKVLSGLKDGIEVKGKLVKLSISRDRDVLYLGHICKEWTKEDVLRKLKGYGIENIVEIQVPKDSKNDKKIKGFAFLRFNTFSDATAALHRLRKSDAVFGSPRRAKIDFARTPMHSREESRLQVKTIYVEGVPKSWDVHKLKEICEQYAETKKVKISRNLGNKGKDFGFISFTTRGGAVACLEGMNKLRYGENVKVKAYIARPLVRVRLQKSSCVGLKFNRRHRKTDWWKMKGHARSKGAEKESDVKAPTVVNKSNIRGTEEKSVAIVYKNNQGPLISKHTIEGKTNEQQSIAPEARDAGAGLSTKPQKTDVKRKNRKRQRDRLHNKRSPNKPEGTSQGRHSRSSRSSKSKFHVRKGHGRSADSNAYRIPFKEAYAASTSGHPGSGYSGISGSKRPSSDLEPHAGLARPVKHGNQYHAECVKPGFLYQRQTYADRLKPYTRYEIQPPVKYFKPAMENEALPHAGFLESSFGKQSFAVDDYAARRIAGYSGPNNQGPVHGAGSAYSRPFALNNTSYSRYEGSGGYHRFNGAYPPTQTRY
ncbi:hypothetical protein HRI_003199000 [Hibiscus trionum]|uniref:RRM domain-containing protein n=1 Tax=Hibiscus trionum TaxID=183268 RepID=A0A9W7M9G8_HIBTR|nr:hypothetical protein HRI_003199000 [Hibiscus trionum]